MVIYIVADLVTYYGFFYVTSYEKVRTFMGVISVLELIASAFMVKIMFSKIREKQLRRFLIPLFCYFMYLMYYIYSIMSMTRLVAGYNGYNAYLFFRSYLRIAEILLAVYLLLEYRDSLEKVHRVKVIAIIILIAAGIQLIAGYLIPDIAGADKVVSILIIGFLSVCAVCAHLGIYLTYGTYDKKGTTAGNLLLSLTCVLLSFGYIGNYLSYRGGAVVEAYQPAEVYQDITASEGDDLQDCVDSLNEDGITDAQLTDKQKHLQGQIDDYLKAYEKEFSGAVMVQSGNQTIYKKAYGYANAADKRRNTCEEVCPIALCTGEFTTAAIYQLTEQGKIHLDDTLDKYLPDYDMAHLMTVTDLLNHTSGIENYEDIIYRYTGVVTELYGEDSGSLDATYPIDQHMTKILSGISLTAKPGQEYVYNRTDYYLLGLVIERVSGQTYEDYIREHLLEPAGLTHTGFKKSEVTSTGYQWGKPVKMSKQDCYYYSVTGMYSTVADLIQWEKALTDGTLLSKDTLNALLTQGKLSETTHGWEIKDSGYKAFSTDYGYTICQYMNLEQDIQIVAIFNTDSGVAVNPILDLEDQVYEWVQKESEGK